ncbi:hypothetical protein [Kingella oralis]|nr:hypothetical protein [Kingella oralis]
MATNPFSGCLIQLVTRPQRQPENNPQPAYNPAPCHFPQINPHATF